MSDTPSRTEIAAQLQAAEARTETRIAQLSLAIETRASASDHKIDLLAADVRALVDSVAELRSDYKIDYKELKGDYKEIRKTIWVVGSGAVLAIGAMVLALWVAGINAQANMIPVFQTALSVRAIPQAAEAPSATPVPQGQRK